MLNMLKAHEHHRPLNMQPSKGLNDDKRNALNSYNLFVPWHNCL